MPRNLKKPILRILLTYVLICIEKHWNTWFWVDGAKGAVVNLMKVAFNESLWENNKQGHNPEAWKLANQFRVLV